MHLLTSITPSDRTMETSHLVGAPVDLVVGVTIHLAIDAGMSNAEMMLAVVREVTPTSIVWELLERGLRADAPNDDTPDP